MSNRDETFDKWKFFAQMLKYQQACFGRIIKISDQGPKTSAQTEGQKSKTGVAS